jgi:hypothetical protein
MLRSALPAAIACAVLAAATLSGAHHGGSLAIGMVRETGPTLAGSISTIRNPNCKKHSVGFSHDRALSPLRTNASLC